MIKIYSDGGSRLVKREETPRAGAAAIIHDVSLERSVRIQAFLGHASDHEAELLAGIIGILTASLISEVDTERHWVTDRESLTTLGKPSVMSPSRQVTLSHLLVDLLEQYSVRVSSPAIDAERDQISSCDTACRRMIAKSATFDWDPGTVKAGPWKTIDLSAIIDAASGSPDTSLLQAKLSSALRETVN